MGGKRSQIGKGLAWGTSFGDLGKSENAGGRKSTSSWENCPRKMSQPRKRENALRDKLCASVGFRQLGTLDFVGKRNFVKKRWCTKKIGTIAFKDHATRETRSAQWYNLAAGLPRKVENCHAVGGWGPKRKKKKNPGQKKKQSPKSGNPHQFHGKPTKLTKRPQIHEGQ